MTKIFPDIVDREISATEQNDWREVGNKRGVYKQLANEMAGVEILY